MTGTQGARRRTPRAGGTAYLALVLAAVGALLAGDGVLLTLDERELGRDRLLILAWESTVWTEPHHENWTVHWNRPVPGEGCDLTVNEGPALEGYREAGRAPYFRQPVPAR
ncbi:hypothetical protein [Streptomyces sp. NPDC055036]